MNSTTVNDEYYQLEDETIDKIIFTKENVDHMCIYQKSVEIVGIIGDTEMVPSLSLMKFNLINKNEDVIEIAIWDLKIIDKVKAMIMPGNVIHLDGAFVKPKNLLHSKSTITFDLHVQNNTKLRVLKSRTSIYKAPSDLKDITTTNIEECTKHTDLIQIVAWLKNKIKETSISATAKINQGCLSDCQKFKLEIRTPVSLDPHILNNFDMGSHIKVTGILKYSNIGHPYLWVTDNHNIILQSNEKRKLSELLKGTKIPKRIRDENIDSNFKRIKSE